MCKTTAALSVCLFLAGCATSPRTVGGDGTGLAEGQHNLTARGFAILGSGNPSSVQQSSSPATQIHRLAAIRYVGLGAPRPMGYGQPINLADLYTRLIIVNQDALVGNCSSNCQGSVSPEEVRDYELEKRGWLAKLLSNRKIGITTLANVEVQDPPVPVRNLPLFSLTHDSVRGQGEVFASLLTGSHVQTPLFRLTANTAITIHLNTNISDEKAFAISPVVLKAVQAAVQIAAPTSTVYTTLSKDEVGNAAKALDTALNGLFSQTITEDIQIGSLSSGWNLRFGEPAYDVVVRGLVPGDLVHSKADEGADPYASPSDHVIGTWDIEALCPRPSLFDARDICSAIGNTRPAAGGGSGASGGPNPPSKIAVTDADAIKTLVNRTKHDILLSLTPSQVLSANLSSAVTIQDFVKVQQFYTDFIGRDSKSRTDADTITFCANARDALYKVGLNQFDATLVLWAMDQSMSGISDLSSHRVHDVCTSGTESTIDLRGGTDVLKPPTLWTRVGE